MDKQEEIWRPIKGYEGFYEVSNRGRVRSVDRWVIGKDGKKHFYRGQILKPWRDKRTGYLYVGLHRDGKQPKFLVHRLVAEAFIPNPENKPQINHRDEDKSNNFVENLSYCSAKENSNWGTRNKRSAASRLNGKLSKAVQAIDPKTGQVVREFPSTAEAERNGFDHSTISKCCLGKKRTYKGYRWRYKPVSN